MRGPWAGRCRSHETFFRLGAPGKAVDRFHPRPAWITGETERIVLTVRTLAPVRSADLEFDDRPTSPFLRPAPSTSPLRMASSPFPPPVSR